MPEKQYNPRRTFSIKGQLLGKLGQHGFSELLQGLETAAGGKYVPGEARKDTRPPKRRRRGGRGRKQVAS